MFFSKSVRKFVRKFNIRNNMAVKFYLEKRLSKQGEAPIRCSVMIKGNRLTTTTGYSIKPELWNADRQEARQTAGGKPVVNSKGKTAKVINAHLKRIDSFFSDYENSLTLSGESVADLKAVYNGEFGKAGRGNVAEANGFFDYFDEFTAEMGARNDWTASTFGKFAALKKHIADFAPAIEFADLDNNGLTKFVEFLRNTLDMRNSTIGKQLGFLKWFLRWATQKGYNQETAYQQFSPKLKATENKVVFLEWDELMKVYCYEFPEVGTVLNLADHNGIKYEKRTTVGKRTLEQVRDVFCFCCFTSLRYSDVANLKRSDVYADHITITTIKTADTLKIELNKYAHAILDKYEGVELPFNRALPVVSNQRMNEYLKELGEICGLNTPITEIYYKGNQRIENVLPKWQMIGTHTGRRTFICNALMLGISPQIVMKWTGHSDYKAMKPYIDIADAAKAEAMKLFDR